MFIYSDFKSLVVGGDFKKAETMLDGITADSAVFSALANVSMFLSLIFRYPDEDVWQTLQDNWSSFDSFFKEYIDEVPSLYDNTEMESDFIILFKQDFKGQKIVPYISYYTESNKMLYGDSTFKMREWMAEEGFVLDAEAAELEDNFFVVLEFMSAIFKNLASGAESASWFRSLSNLYKLLDNYGPVIADEFAVKVSERSDKPFYAACGKLLGAFIKDVDNIMEDVFSSAE